MLWDGEGRILFANRQVEVLLDYDRADLLGQPVEMLLPEALRRAHHGHRAGFAARPSVRAMGANGQAGSGLGRADHGDGHGGVVDHLVAG